MFWKGRTRFKESFLGKTWHLLLMLAMIFPFCKLCSYATQKWYFEPKLRYELQVAEEFAARNGTVSENVREEQTEALKDSEVYFITGFIVILLTLLAGAIYGVHSTFSLDLKGKLPKLGGGKLSDEGADRVDAKFGGSGKPDAATAGLRERRDQLKDETEKGRRKKATRRRKTSRAAEPPVQSEDDFDFNW